MTPARLNVSLRRLPLILRSNGLSNASEGERLTSSSHGLYLIIIKLYYLLKIIIQDDVVTEEFKTICSMDVSLLRLNLYLFFNTDKALDNNIIYLRPHKVKIDSLLFKMITQSIKTPFEPTIVVIGILDL